MAKATREQGIYRALDILDCLAENGEPMITNEIAAAMGAPRSTVYQLTKVLLSRSILEKIGDDGRVFLGKKLFFYGKAVYHENALYQIAKPIIAELSKKTGERAELCTNVDWKQYILYVAEGPRPYFFKPYPGGRYPLPLTATGRFFIAEFDDETLLSEIPLDDYQHNGKTLLTFADFRKESNEAAKQGYCIVSGLLDPYLTVISMPIFDARNRLIAATALSFPSGELEDGKSRFLEAQREAKLKLEQALSRSG